MAGPVAVRGLRELNQAFARAPRKLKTEFRQGQRELAEPIRATAEQRAITEITGLARSREWSRMRTGVTQRVVYVAPRARNRGGSKRRNLAGLLMDRAMQPALNQHQFHVLRKLDDLLATVGRDWER